MLLLAVNKQVSTVSAHCNCKESNKDNLLPQKTVNVDRRAMLNALYNWIVFPRLCSLQAVLMLSCNMLS